MVKKILTLVVSGFNFYTLIVLECHPTVPVRCNLALKPCCDPTKLVAVLQQGPFSPGSPALGI